MTAALGTTLAHASYDATLAGSISYLRWKDQSNYAPEVALLNLTSNTSTTLIDFPDMSFESLFFENVVYDWRNGTLIISLQYDTNITNGLLLEYDLATRALVRVVNSTYCWYLAVDENDPNSLLCLTGEHS